MYRLDYDLLLAAGVPVETIAPENYQVYGYEKEHQIWIEGADDGTFGPGDFIVFYGEKTQHGWIQCSTMIPTTWPINTTHFTVTPFIIF